MITPWIDPASARPSTARENSPWAKRCQSSTTESVNTKVVVLPNNQAAIKNRNFNPFVLLNMLIGPTLLMPIGHRAGHD